MVRYEPNKKIEFLYAVRNFRTGQTVTLIIYDLQGNQKTSKTMGEIGSQGIYKAQFIPTQKGTFYAVMNCAAYPFKKWEKFIVGGKPGDFREGGGAAALKFPPTLTRKEYNDLIFTINKINDKLGVLTESQHTKEIQSELSQLKDSLSKLDNKIYSNVVRKTDELSLTFSSRSKKLFSEVMEKVNELQKLKFNVNNVNQLNKQYTYLIKNIETVDKKFIELKILLDDNYSKLSSLDFSDLNKIENQVNNISRDLEELKIKGELNATTMDGSSSKE